MVLEWRERRWWQSLRRGAASSKATGWRLQPASFISDTDVGDGTFDLKFFQKGSCPLRVISGHLQCNRHVRFTPESGHVRRFGPKVNVAPFIRSLSSSG